jgi:hypothetical protein
VEILCDSIYVSALLPLATACLSQHVVLCPNMTGASARCIFGRCLPACLFAASRHTSEKVHSREPDVAHGYCNRHPIAAQLGATLSFLLPTLSSEVWKRRKLLRTFFSLSRPPSLSGTALLMGLDGSVGTGLDVMHSIVTSSSSRARSVSCAPCLESRERDTRCKAKREWGMGDKVKLRRYNCKYYI